MLRFPVDPMKATLGTLPHDDGEWAFEIKWDGYRTLAFVDGGQVRLQSSHLLDVTVKYPELADLASGVNAGSAILDGELAVLDADGKPRFELIQRHESQAVFHVFDVLQIDGQDTIGLGYEQRRALLGQLVERGPNWIVPAHRIGDGAALLAVTAAQGLEGVMAKRLDSTYVPGKRSNAWRKVKNRVRTVVTIGGFSPGTGNRLRTFGALLVGREQPDGSLAFAGGVGSGFSQRVLEDLLARLRSLAVDTCPFSTTPPREYTRGATWVQPVLRAELEITEFTNDGYVRQASFTGLVE